MITRTMEMVRENHHILKTKDFSKLWKIDMDNGNNYVTKFNLMNLVKGEAKFYNYYNTNRFFPSVMKEDKDGEYFIYTYIKGKQPNKEEKIKVLEEFIEVIVNKYSANNEIFGHGLLGENSSWEEFLKSKLEFANDRIGMVLEKEDYSFIMNVLKDLCKDTKEDSLYYLHGNASLDNMIVENNDFKGMINAKPLVGDPIYDFMYAYTSTPYDLTSKNIKNLLKKLKPELLKSKKDIYRYLLICLYINIGNALRGDCKDIVEYVFQWTVWKRRYNEFK